MKGRSMGYQILLTGIGLWIISFFYSARYLQFLTLGSHLIAIALIIIICETRILQFKESFAKLMEAIEKVSKDVKDLKAEIKK